MSLLWVMLISILLGFHSFDRPIVTKQGNITTIHIGDKTYKSIETEIGEAWSSE